MSGKGLPLCAMISTMCISHESSQAASFQSKIGSVGENGTLEGAVQTLPVDHNHSYSIYFEDDHHAAHCDTELASALCCTV